MNQFDEEQSDWLADSKHNPWTIGTICLVLKLQNTHTMGDRFLWFLLEKQQNHKDGVNHYERNSLRNSTSSTSSIHNKSMNVLYMTAITCSRVIQLMVTKKQPTLFEFLLNVIIHHIVSCFRFYLFSFAYVTGPCVHAQCE